MVLSPSLFIEDYRYSPPLEKLIRTAFSRGHVPFKGKLLRTTCATVISIDEPLIGTFPGQNIVEIPTERSRATLPILRPKDEQEIADRFQPKLLMYRLQNYKEVLNSAFDAPSLTYPVSELARGLAACVVDDPKRQADIVNLLSTQNERAEQDLSLDLRVTVLKALLYLCHKGKKQSIHVGDVTAAANSIVEDSGELSPMTPRMVGSKLHLLGLATARLDSAGRGLQLNNELRKRIHQVVWNYRVQFPTQNGNQCDQCREILAQGEGK